MYSCSFLSFRCIMADSKYDIKLGSAFGIASAKGYTKEWQWEYTSETNYSANRKEMSVGGCRNGKDGVLSQNQRDHNGVNYIVTLETPRRTPEDQRLNSRLVYVLLINASARMGDQYSDATIIERVLFSTPREYVPCDPGCLVVWIQFAYCAPSQSQPASVRNTVCSLLSSQQPTRPAGSQTKSTSLNSI